MNVIDFAFYFDFLANIQIFILVLFLPPHLLFYTGLGKPKKLLIDAPWPSFGVKLYVLFCAIIMCTSCY